MWDDDDSVFPTRQGNAPGKSMERKMQGSGQGDFRTVIRDNPDGSTTMLRTRNGFPEFTTTGGGVTIRLIESDYLLREYWEGHALYLTTFSIAVPFKYLKSITLVDNLKLEFASPPTDKLENADYYAAESKRSRDGLFTYFLFHPKRALVTRGGSTLRTVLFANPLDEAPIEFYGYRNALLDDGVADEKETAWIDPYDPNAINFYSQNGFSYSRNVAKSFAGVTLKDVAK